MIHKTVQAEPISYKIKVKPEEFCVRESSSLSIIADDKQSSRYNVYLLKKSGWSSIDLIHKIARLASISYSDICYGGKKDRHAYTEQYITTKQKLDITSHEKNWSLTRIGYADQNMSPELIEGNFFEIHLRNLKGENIPHVKRELLNIQKLGVPNYFDSQRFGTYRKGDVFAAQQILNRKYDDALITILTEHILSDKKEERERKLNITKNKNDYKKLSAYAKTQNEKKIFAFLSEHATENVNPTNREKIFKSALEMLPAEELSMAFSKLQSYLWNLAAMDCLSSNFTCAELQQKWGRLVFPVDDDRRTSEEKNFASADKQESLFFKKILEVHRLELPVPGFGVKVSGEHRERYDRICKKFNLTVDQFENAPSLKKAFLHGYMRKLWIVPEHLEWLPHRADDMFKGRRVASFKFFLPRGSYGTIIVKRITFKY